MAVSLAVLAGGASVAGAQQGDLKPPQPKGDVSAPFMTSLVVFVVVAGVLGAAVMPSKRGHQD